MPEYFYNNEILPEWQILEAAKEEGVSLDEFLKSMPDITVEEPEVEEATVQSNDVYSDLPKFEHITEENFLELSKEGFGIYGKGREEVIVPKLKELYAKDTEGNDSGIKFEEVGAGNSVKITLPGNDYGEVFDLPSADDVAGVL